MNNSKIRSKPFKSIFLQILLMIAGFLLVCILSPFSISAGQISITLQTFILFTVTAILGKKKGTIIALLYLIAGALGAPVFSNFSSGWDKLTGITAGFIWSFPVCCYVLGEMVECRPKNISRLILSFFIVHFILLILGFGYIIIFVEDYLFTFSSVLPLLPGLVVKSLAGGVISHWFIKFLNSFQ